jgi:hypothetical protein
MNELLPPRNIVCVVVDRLQTGMVGAYGNTWIETPAFDHLAADGFLFERAVIDSPRLDSLYRAYWQGLHAMAPADVKNPWTDALPNRLAKAGIVTALVTDEPWLAAHPGAAGFAQRELVELEKVTEPADEIAQTQLARLFAVASARTLQLPQPFCLWLHAGSIGRVWDAPLELRNRYAEQDDPAPFAGVDVPCRRLAKNFDPDELLAVAHAYAGQVTLLDECLAGLFDALVESPAGRSTLVVVLSARGFPLGEHGWLGPCDEAVYSEVAQIPWLLRLPDGQGASERTQALAQPADLHATLADWCGLDVESAMPHAARGRSLLPLVTSVLDDSNYPRDRACISAPPHERAIVTPAWFLRVDAAGTLPAAAERDRSSRDSGASEIELFAKPEDRFEVNEVSNRAVDVVSELLAALTQFEQACQNPGAVELSPLPEVLLVGMD